MPVSNRVNALGTAINVTQNFSAAVDGWLWRASNAGPSGSRVVDSGVGTGKCLQLVGGSLGHYEELQFLGFLDPHGSYSLTYSIKADAAFATQPGEAGWYLQFFTASGETVRVLVSSTGAATPQWQTVGPVQLNTTAAATLGLNSHVIKVGLLLVNAKYQLDYTAAASLYVTDIVLTGTSTAQPYGYDANGNVTAAPARNLASLSYEAVSGLPSVVTLTGVEAQSVSYAYDASGLRSAAIADYGNGVSDKTLYLRDPFGNLLMRRQTSGGAEAVTSFLPDLSGSLATHNDGGERYLLKDVLGSSCVEVSATGDSSSQFQYGPFGELLVGPSGDELSYRYTGQEQDQALDIYNYNARLYDPALRRFYACDPAGQYASPYLYTGDDPINSTDPTGTILIRLALNLAASFAATYFAPFRDRYLAALGTGNDILSQKERAWVEGSNLFFLDRIMPYVLSRYKTQNIVEVERSNAMAHFTWQSHVTFIHGPEVARMLGDAHETGVIRPGPDTIADKINNAMGRETTVEESIVPNSWSMLQHITTVGLIYGKTALDRLRDSFVKDPKSSLHWWISLSHFIPRDTSDWLFEREWRAGHLSKATTDPLLFEKLNSAQIHQRFSIPLLHLSRTYGVRPQDILNSGELALLRDYTHWYSEWGDPNA